MLCWCSYGTSEIIRGGGNAGPAPLDPTGRRGILMINGCRLPPNDATLVSRDFTP